MAKFVFLLQFETHSLSSIYVHCIVVITFGIMQMNKNLGTQERWIRSEETNVYKKNNIKKYNE